MPEEHNVNINVRIQDDTGRDEEELDEIVEPIPATPATLTITRAQTSRYKTYQSVTMCVGKTIGEIRQELWGPFDLAEKCVATRNGESVGDEVRPMAGDRVHFAPAPKERGQ